MSEWILLIYLMVLLACLMLAARFQPQNSPAASDEPEPDHPGPSRRARR